MSLRGKLTSSPTAVDHVADRKTQIERQLFALSQKFHNIKYPMVLNTNGAIVYQYAVAGDMSPDFENYAMNLIDIGAKISALFSLGSIQKIKITGLHRTLVNIHLLTDEFVLVFFLEVEPITRALLDYNSIEDEILPFVDKLVNVLS